MKAVILAAGTGARLGGGPKILLQVGGRTLLQRHLDNLDLIGVPPEDVILVAGHQADRVWEAMPAECGILVNTEHEFTGSLASFMLVGAEEDLLVMNGDLVWDHRIGELVLSRRGGIVAAVDADSVRDGALRAKEIEGNRFLLSLDIPVADSCGEAVGITLLGARTLHLAREVGWRILTISGRTASFESLLADVSSQNLASVATVNVTGIPWEDIDTEADLMRAGRSFPF